MAESEETKRARFARIFPARAKKLEHQLQLLANCSNQSNYEWNPELLRRVWLELARQFSDTCSAFDLELNIEVDGIPIHLLED